MNVATELLTEVVIVSSKQNEFVPGLVDTGAWCERYRGVITIFCTDSKEALHLLDGFLSFLNRSLRRLSYAMLAYGPPYSLEEKLGGLTGDG
jgi:hypothetical protein